MQAIRSVCLDRLKRFVCLLLIFVLLFCFFLAPRAQAVALEATTIAYGGLLVGTILVGAGVVFSSRGDMAKVGAAMYKTLVNGSSAIGKTISTISAWAVEHGTSLAKGALRVGKDMYQAIVDAFNASYSSGYFFDGQHFSIAENSSKSDVESFGAAIGALMVSGSNVVIGGYVANEYSGRPESYKFDISYPQGVWKCVLTVNGKTESPITLSNVNAGSLSVTARMKPQYAKTCAYVTLNDTYGWYFYAPTILSVGGASYSVNGSDLAYPSDDYLVKMPDIPSVDSATGDVTYPDSIAYTKDAVAAPYPIGDDGVKVPDIPFDIPVDQTSGKPMDDTGTDTDTPSKPGTDTPSDTVNWPSASDLSLPKLIISKFPFSIPFDVANMIALLEADPKAPVFKMPLKVGSMVDEEIVLDLEQFSDVIRIIRWGELILFVAGLAYVTRNYIKW